MYSWKDKDKILGELMSQLCGVVWSSSFILSFAKTRLSVVSVQWIFSNCLHTVYLFYRWKFYCLLTKKQKIPPKNKQTNKRNQNCIQPFTEFMNKAFQISHLHNRTFLDQLYRLFILKSLGHSNSEEIWNCFSASVQRKFPSNSIQFKSMSSR